MLTISRPSGVIDSFGIAQIDVRFVEPCDRLPLRPIARANHAHHAVEPRNVAASLAKRAVQVVAVRGQVGERRMCPARSQMRSTEMTSSCSGVSCAAARGVPAAQYPPTIAVVKSAESGAEIDLARCMIVCPGSECRGRRLIITCRRPRRSGRVEQLQVRRDLRDFGRHVPLHGGHGLDRQRRAQCPLGPLACQVRASIP